MNIFFLSNSCLYNLHVKINMENKTVNASNSSNDSALMVIPTKNDVPCDNSDDTVGLENPNKVRNLKDILKFTTQMTNPSNENENNDLKFTEEVSINKSLVIRCLYLRYCS